MQREGLARRPSAPAARRRKRPPNWRKRLLIAGLILLTLIVTAFFVLTDATPAADARDAPTPQQVGAGRDAVFQLRASRSATGGVNQLRLGAAQLDGLSALATHGFRPDRLDLYVYEQTFYATASHRLPLGRWLNVKASVEESRAGFPQVRMAIGSLPLSPSLSRVLLNMGRWGLSLRGASVPPLDDMVRAFSVRDGVIAATVHLPPRSGVIDQLAGSETGLDPALVLQTYCRLAQAQTLDPKADLATQVQRAFPVGRVADASIERNRAAFVALAMAIVDTKVGALAGIAPAQTARCPMPAIAITLHGRDDLPKHWSLSAALAAGTGKQLAESIGEWKELADSLSKQSEFQPGDPTGFSFIDISADRSGFRIAGAAVTDAMAKEMATRLSMATQDQILPLSLMTFKEGGDVDFAGRYGGLNDPRYAKAIAGIDEVLDRDGLTPP